MKKPYQIEAQRAVKQLEAMAADGNPAVQMILPMAEMVGWLRKGVGELIRQAGLQLMDLLMQEEVWGLAGERSQRQPERTASRWGTERGYCDVSTSGRYSGGSRNTNCTETTTNWIQLFPPEGKRRNLNPGPLAPEASDTLPSPP
jgi:hypothetical protein